MICLYTGINNSYHNIGITLRNIPGLIGLNTVEVILLVPQWIIWGIEGLTDVFRFGIFKQACIQGEADGFLQ